MSCTSCSPALSSASISCKQQPRLIVDFYYDVVSPYSYFAHEVFTRYIGSNKWNNIDFRLKPVFLGGVMQGSGNRPPAQIPAKAVWLLQDIVRNSTYFQIAIRQPDQFPINTLNAMRLLSVVEKEQPQLLQGLNKNLWIRYWAQNKDIVTQESLLEACSNVGIDPELAKKWLQVSQEQENKDRLKQLTTEAVNKGAFGAPTFYVRNADGTGKEEMFWGSDRFPHFAELYGLPWEGPNPIPRSKF